MKRMHALVGMAIGIAALSGAVGLAACNAAKQDGEARPCECAELVAAVDTTMMAYLSKARAAHHQVDLLEQEDRWGEAVERLEQFVASPSPGGGTLPEVQEVLADTFARLADLRGHLGRYDDAEQAITQGLARAPADSYFEGHLYEVRGVNEQRRAASLAERGETAGARAAREAAMKAFERAVEIQDRVVDRALAGDGGADGG